MMRRFSTWMALASLAWLVGCGSGGGSQSAQVANVEIQQTGLILTEAGAVRQLSAKATDAEGNAVDVTTTWTSTNPSAIAVDGTGKVTAASSNGASQIVAEAGGITSAPLLVVVTQPALNAILLTDSQIVGDPVETTPGAVASFDNTYQVSLTGVTAPAVGAILINTESKAVAGRVLQVDSTSVPIRVTLGLVSLRELFPNLEINETIDLANAPIRINPEIAAAYDIKRTGNTFEFTPKQSSVIAAAVRAVVALFIPQAAAAGPFALGPFKCETSITGGEGASLPIVLSTPPLFSVTASPTLDLKLNLVGVERFVINAEPTVKVEGGINVAIAFEGKIECKVELFAYVIPVGGPLALILGGVVPMGVGLEAGGKLTLATMGIGTKAELKSKVKAGIACPSGIPPCSFERSMEDLTAKVTPTLDVPSLGDVRLEPSLSAVGYMEATIGNVFLKSLRFDFVKVKSGANLAGSFALLASQLDDPAYSSDYKISMEASAGVGGNLGDVLKLLGISSLNAVELKISTDLAKSPAGLASGAVTADKASFVFGDTVNFTVKLDPATIDFFPGFGPYNVSKVQLVRGRTLLTTSVVATANATPGQTEFSFAFTAPNSGSAGEFSAFVVTTLLPFDLLALEVGSASAPGDSALDVTAEAGSKVAEILETECPGFTGFSHEEVLAADRPLPLTLSIGSTSMTFVQESPFVYTVNMSTVVPPAPTCEGANFITFQRFSTILAVFRVMPRRSGTLTVEAVTGVTAGQPISDPTITRVINLIAGTPSSQIRTGLVVESTPTAGISLTQFRAATLTFTPAP